MATAGRDIGVSDLAPRAPGDNHAGPGLPRVRQLAAASRPRGLHSMAGSRTLRSLMQITTVAWLMQMRRRPRCVEDGVLGA